MTSRLGKWTAFRSLSCTGPTWSSLFPLSRLYYRFLGEKRKGPNGSSLGAVSLYPWGPFGLCEQTFLAWKVSWSVSPRIADSEGLSSQHLLLATNRKVLFRIQYIEITSALVLADFPVHAPIL